MERLKTISIISICIMLLFGTTCFANNNVLRTLDLQKTVSLNDSNDFESKIQDEITSDNVSYKLIETTKVENKNKLQIEKEVQEELIVTTDDKYAILNLFDQNKEIQENGYSGVLNLQNDSLEINVNESHQEQYKVYLQKKYENVSRNELNDIPKQVKKNGITYYLVNPIWNVTSTQNIGGNDVPSTYTGIMNYEGVQIKTVVNSYKATVKYSGVLEKEVIDSITFNMKYEEIPNDTNYIVPAVATASGILFFSGIIILRRKNVKVYNYSADGYKLIKKLHINKNDTVIDITPIKIRSNKYKIILSNRLLNELRNTSIKIKYFDRQFLYVVTDNEIEINV